jgi:hypothetical protein
MKTGMFQPHMSAVGGRPDIGLLPAYYAAAVLSMDKRAIALVLACGNVGGSWSIHIRDTSTGPGKGMPMSCVNWPYATSILSAADVNPSTGQKELITIPASGGGLEAEESHTPNFAYLPYLLTGDKFYLEEMHFWIMGIMICQNYSYRQKEKSIVQPNQTRGQAWLMRGLVESAALTPDSHPLKSHFKYWVSSNAANYDALFTNNPQANVLGVLDTDGDCAYSMSGTRNGVGRFLHLSHRARRRTRLFESATPARMEGQVPDRAHVGRQWLVLHQFLLHRHARQAGHRPADLHHAGPVPSWFGRGCDRRPGNLYAGDQRCAL